LEEREEGSVVRACPTGRRGKEREERGSLAP